MGKNQIAFEPTSPMTEEEQGICDALLRNVKRGGNENGMARLG
jgi:hypothetical protein